MKRSMKRLVSIAICLVMVLALLPVGVFAAGTTTVYCQVPDGWTGCNAYWWGGSGTAPAWPGVAMSESEEGIWTYDVPSDATGLIFNDGSTQTDDLTVPTDDKVMYVFSNSYWTTYGKVEVVTEYFVAGSAGLCGVEWTPGATQNKMSDADADGVYTITYTGIAAGSYEFKVTNGSWAESWGLDGGQDNYPLVIEEADSTVQISFDPEAKLVTAVVNGTEPELPPEEPIGTVFYVAGSFNSWNAAAEGYQMISSDDVTYTLSFPLDAGSYSMKVTDGTWTNAWGGTGEGGNYEFNVGSDNATVTVSFDSANQVVNVVVDEGSSPAVTLISAGTATFADVDASFEGVLSTFVPAEDGTVTVDISACDPGFYVDLYADGEWIAEYLDSVPDTISIDVDKGVTYEIWISSVNVYSPTLYDFVAGSVSYKITADVAAGEPGGDDPVPGTEEGSSETNPKVIPAYYTTDIPAGETVWFLYDNHQHMVEDGVYSMMLQISSGTDYAVTYRGMDVPVDENGFVAYEMYDMQMQGSYLFSVTNNGAVDSFFSIEVKDRPAYVVSDYTLVLGDNAVAPDADYANTLYEFVPEETGVYKFTVTEGVIGDWGSIFNPVDNTETKGTTLEWTCTAVGQSIVVGIAETDEAIVSVVKTGEYVAEDEVPWTDYVNTYDFSYEVPENPELTAIDVFDDQADSFGVDKDGFCRYGSKYGLLMFMDLNEFPINLEDMILNGQARVTLMDDSGKVTKRIDYNEALTEYLEAGLVVVTEELATMLRQLGDQHGWWLAGGFVFEEEAPEDAATAWMDFCSYLPGTELDPEEDNGTQNGGSNNQNGSQSGGNSNQNGSQSGSNSNPKTADISLIGAVVTMVLTGGSLAVLKKKEDIFHQ